MQEAIEESSNGKESLRDKPFAISDSSDVPEKLKQLLVEVTGIEANAFDEKTSFEQLGISSILAIQLLKKMEAVFGLHLYVNELQEHSSVGALTTYLKQELKSTKGLDAKIVNKHNRPVVFILSTPRAGSTLLRSMLGGHDAIFAPPELNLLPFDDLKQRRQHYQDNKQGLFLEGYVEAIKTLEDISVEDAKQCIHNWEETSKGIVSVYEQLCELADGRFVVDKSPGYAADIEVLRRAEDLLEQPIYIHLVRHPLSVMSSFVQNRFNKMLGKGDEDPWGLAQDVWRQMNENVEKFFKDVNSSRCYRVRYEDLVTDPEFCVKGIVSFLGIDYQSSMIEPYQGERMIHGLHDNSVTIGDPNFLTHNKVEKDLANAWKKHAHRWDEFTESTYALAQDYGYGREGISEVSSVRSIDKEVLSAGKGEGYLLPRRVFFWIMEKILVFIL